MRIGTSGVAFVANASSANHNPAPRSAYVNHNTSLTGSGEVLMVALINVPEHHSL